MRKRRQTVEMPPQFFKIILSPHASKLHIPDEFVIKYGADLRDVVFLEVPTGAIWQVKLLQNSNGTKWLNHGWNHFKEYYSIAIGYFLLFQYNGNSHFSVFIFDLSASEIEYLSGPNEDNNNNNNAKVAHPVSRPNCLAERQEVKLEKPDVEEDLTYATQKHKKKEKNLYNGHCNEAPVVDPSTSKMTTTNQHSKKRTATSLDASNCRYPLRSKQLKDVKIEKGDVEGRCNEAPVVDPSTSKVTTTNQHSKKRTAASLDASNCRYPLRSKQLKEVKIEKGDVKEHCNKIPVVDPSATKMTTTPRHHEKKTSACLDTSHCKYPLRNKQLKEVKLEKTNAEEDLLYVAQKAMRKKANNVKLEKGDVEERSKAGDPSASTTTNQHNEKKTTTPLDASHCRYPLRSKQHIEVKLELWETGGNMHNKTPKNKVVADSPYCIRQNLGLPASSSSYQPVRVKLEKPDNLFCAAEKVKGRETNNVKLDTGDLEGNLIAASYKGKDSTASEMTVLGKKKMFPSEKHNRDMYFNPHFTVSMQPTCVSRNFQLDIPVEFFKKCLNEEETIVNLRVSNGRSWRAKLLDIQSNCPKMESSGWRDFVLDNNLKEHDTCVFELIDGIEPMLDVTIFRATTPVS
ncbi:B3 domain-containing protein Os01g0905400-like [Solanum verrucosum]|uniref:B3 domain-containing protein Os01g0905400-like n=1 Tax=Solanum verrucosum TaxID=315347 RepID=UPI0020D0EB47|nr:B3 domain-containing protein Os01g0905400-like [Solanum verrucosum]